MFSLPSAMLQLLFDESRVCSCPCHPGSVCDFEEDGLCGFTSPTGEWTKDIASNLESITGLDTDHSTRTASGIVTTTFKRRIYLTLGFRFSFLFPRKADVMLLIVYQSLRQEPVYVLVVLFMRR